MVNILLTSDDWAAGLDAEVPETRVCSIAGRLLDESLKGRISIKENQTALDTLYLSDWQVMQDLVLQLTSEQQAVLGIQNATRLMDHKHHTNHDSLPVRTSGVSSLKC